ncbi:hypothetical protein DL766_007878 [Monosporascus sp. MC13-8B]|uniref:Inhibitor of growth protein N-terminal histone-binding domain-containing protein n=1 Tax=Monosporascus cannonballus TaxID=155416 RepID=A0ABY0HFT9_9PEZI|nr:hypothetical protein DL763_010244 [Monosporascus cannonballus]RYO90407.1 hypothetical protein DL762_002737 [Monosporascus cannonballus]RYP21706.1 hypothetical protein DL766_007878 [Monosporascus sp. MC13-8B]
MPRWARGSEKSTPDYRDRWPTQQTLMVPAAVDGVPIRIKALEAISASLGWLNLVIEHLQKDIDDHIYALEAKRRERLSVMRLETSPRRGVFGTPKPGKSTNPYDTGVPPMATSETVPVVEPWKSDVSNEPEERPKTGRFVLFRKVSKAQASPEPAPAQESRHSHGHTGPSRALRVVDRGGAEPRRKCRWRLFGKKREWQTAQTAEKLREAEEVENVAAPISPRERWKKAKDRRPSAYPGRVRDPASMAAQRAPKDPSPKDRQKGTVPPSADTGPSIPDSPLVRFPAALRRHLTSPHKSTTPLDSNADNGGRPSTPGSRRVSLETWALAFRGIV